MSPSQSARRIAGASALALFAFALPRHADAVVTTRVCLLRGMEETPANTSTAVGAGRFVIDTCAKTVTYRIAVSGLTSAETAAHFHGVADPGVAAGVLTPLPLGTVKTGVWSYPPAIETDLLNGRVYVNVHTGQFPGGEVRGQIVTHVADLDGLQETPATTSTAHGIGLFTYNDTSHTLRYYIAYTGLSAAETAAHIHGRGNYGTAAGVIFPLAVGTPKVGTWAVPSANVNDLINGMLYVNVHTTAFPGGEIRGQIVASVGDLDGGQETPANASTGAGAVMTAIDLTGHVLGYDVRRSPLGTTETASHIHGYSDPGTASGVVQPLAVGVRKMGTWAYPVSNESLILAAKTYVNVHTTALPGGEIRGQIYFPQGYLAPPCVADVDDGSGMGVPDGGVTIDDLLYYLGLFNAGSTRADVDDGSGSGCTDGGVTIDDLLYYLTRFNAGC